MLAVSRGGYLGIKKTDYVTFHNISCLSMSWSTSFLVCTTICINKKKLKR